jgi:hypothetical protein
MVAPTNAALLWWHDLTPHSECSCTPVVADGTVVALEGGGDLPLGGAGGGLGGARGLKASGEQMPSSTVRSLTTAARSLQHSRGSSYVCPTPKSMHLRVWQQGRT